MSPCFSHHCKAYADKLLQLLQFHSQLLDSDLRLTIVQSIILLQHKSTHCISHNLLYPVLFQLFLIQDKTLRSTVYNYIITDIKAIHKSKSHKLNNYVQNYLYRIVTGSHDNQPHNTNTIHTNNKQQSNDTDSILVKYALDIIIECWRRELWFNNEKMINCIGSACIHGSSSVVKSTALHFFLGVKTVREEQNELDDEDRVTQQKQLQAMKMNIKGIVKNKKKRNKLVEKQQKKLNHDVNENEALMINTTHAISLLYNTQSFVEQLFAQLKNNNYTFNLRLLHINIISRVIQVHKIIVLNFYPYLQKYMQPHQKFVTLILTYFAQSIHSLIPPDIIQPCIRTLCNNFISDRSSVEVMTIGLNCVREVCCRQPLCITNELVGDLVQYNKSKHKSVIIAARSLLALFRDKNPAALTRKLRGRAANMTRNEQHVAEYGSEQVFDDIADIELMDDAELNNALNNNDNDEELSEIEFDENELPSDSELPTDNDDDVDVDEQSNTGTVPEDDMIELNNSDDDDGDDDNSELLEIESTGESGDELSDDQSNNDIKVADSTDTIETVSTIPFKKVPVGATKVCSIFELLYDILYPHLPDDFNLTIR